MKESLKTKKEESKMKKLLRNQAGFTLVELMIVIVIVGILAAVAVPIYQSNITKAKMSECDAALGTIRTALRISYAEHGNYPVVATGTEVTAELVLILAPQICKEHILIQRITHSYLTLSL